MGSDKDFETHETQQPVRSANELREWQCKLTLRADHVLEGSMKTRALLRECEHLLYEDEQQTRLSELNTHEAAHSASSDDPVKQRRLQRCDELQQVLVNGRDGLESHGARLDALSRANDRIQRSLRELTFSDAEIAAELAAQAENEATEPVPLPGRGEAEEATRHRAARRAARDARAAKFLSEVDWSRLNR